MRGFRPGPQLLTAFVPTGPPSASFAPLGLPGGDASKPPLFLLIYSGSVEIRKTTQGSALHPQRALPFDPIDLLTRDESLAGAGQRPANVRVFASTEYKIKGDPGHPPRMGLGDSPIGEGSIRRAVGMISLGRAPGSQSTISLIVTARRSGRCPKGVEKRCWPQERRGRRGFRDRSRDRNCLRQGGSRPCHRLSGRTGRRPLCRDQTIGGGRPASVPMATSPGAAGSGIKRWAVGVPRSDCRGALRQSLRSS
jgi:hypothetical protein